jgi:hypothetical protein
MNIIVDRTDELASRNVPGVSEKSKPGRASAFPAVALSSPMFESKDILGLAAAIVMTLGPLAAYSLGWGA